jgi:hypothetical protein
MDGCRRMGLDDAFQIRQVIPVGLLGLGFATGLRWARIVMEKNRILINTIHFYLFHLFLWVKGVQMKETLVVILSQITTILVISFAFRIFALNRFIVSRGGVPPRVCAWYIM